MIFTTRKKKKNALKASEMLENDDKLLEKIDIEKIIEVFNKPCNICGSSEPHVYHCHVNGILKPVTKDFLIDCWEKVYIEANTDISKMEIESFCCASCNAPFVHLQAVRCLEGFGMVCMKCGDAEIKRIYGEKD